MLTEEDKLAIQKMRDMVEATHWIKGSLKRALELEYEDNGYTCKIDPDTGDYKAGKWGHCLMGLVAVVCDIDVREGDEKIPFENKIPIYPQVSRITEALYANLNQYWQERYDSYDEEKISDIVRKALILEAFNDASTIHKSDILELLDRTLAA